MNPFEAHPPLARDDVLTTVVDGRTKGMPTHKVALGDVPAFVRFEGAMFLNGPVWRVEMAGVD